MLPSIITPREKDVLLRLTHGKPNKHIARELGISPSTVRDHLTCLLKAHLYFTTDGPPACFHD